jgi:hypothetical protein
MIAAITKGVTDGMKKSVRKSDRARISLFSRSASSRPAMMPSGTDSSVKYAVLTSAVRKRRSELRKS